MKKFTTLFTVIIILLFTSITFGQTIKTDIYTNYGYGLDSSFGLGNLTKGESKFDIKDVFLGVDYGFTDNFSANAKVRYNETNGIDLYTASINFNTNISKDLDLNLSLGQTESYWYNYTTNLFNNYAIDNVLSDKFNLFDRTKKGLVAQLTNKNITGTFEISNSINNKNKAFNLSLVVIPVKNLQIAGFYNNNKVDYSYTQNNIDSLSNNNVFGGSIFYNLVTKKAGSFKLYGEYIQLDNSNESIDSVQSKKVFTAFCEYFFNESPFSILVKYDKMFSGINDQPLAQYIIGGINYSPNKMYKFGLNWRNAYQFNVSEDNKSHNEVFFTAGFSF